MTKDEAREAAAILLAYAEGKVIEERDKRGCEEYMPEWCPYPASAQPLFNFECYEYRIKPELKVWYLNFTNDRFYADKENIPKGAMFVKVREVIDD